MKGIQKKLISLIVLFVSIGAFAQEPPKKPPSSPDQFVGIIESLGKSQNDAAVAAAKPLANAMIDAQTEAGARPETADRIAEFKRNLFNSLKAKGFTVSQAMQIVIATQPPTPVGPR